MALNLTVGVTRWGKEGVTDPGLMGETLDHMMDLYIEVEVLMELHSKEDLKKPLKPRVLIW